MGESASVEKEGTVRKSVSVSVNVLKCESAKVC